MARAASHSRDVSVSGGLPSTGEDAEEKSEVRHASQLIEHKQLPTLASVLSYLLLSLLLAIVIDVLSPEECVAESLSDAIESVSWHFNVTLNSAVEGIAYELPPAMMLTVGIVLSVLGVCALFAGAELVNSLLAVTVALAVGFFLVQQETRDFLRGDHLEVEVMATFAFDIWWGNSTDHPNPHIGEYLVPFDVSCAFALFVSASCKIPIPPREELCA